MAYKYLQMRDQLLEDALRSGKHRLPSEYEICERYGVSRTTAMRALNALAEENIVRRQVGRGTFLNHESIRTRIHFLISRHIRGLDVFAQEAAKNFALRYPHLEAIIHCVDSRDWLPALVHTPGTKLICSSHVGFLSEMGLLHPLDGMSGFPEVVRSLNADAVVWKKNERGRPFCDSLPLFLAPEALAFNRRYARELGLDDQHGPQSWNELREWCRAAGKMRCGNRPVMGAYLKRDNLLPLSYYLTLSGGEHFLREEQGKMRFDFSCGKKWLGYFQKMQKSGELSEYPISEPEPLLFGRSLLSTQVSCWILQQKERFKTEDPIGIVPLPPVEPGGASFSQIGKSELAIVQDGQAQEKELEAVWCFLRFLLEEPQTQQLLLEKFPCLVINREVSATQQKDPRWLPFFRALATGRVRNDHPRQHQVMKVLYKFFYAAVLDGMPAAQAAAKIEDGCGLLLEIAGL